MSVGRIPAAERITHSSIHPWSTVHVSDAITTHARPERLISLYLDIAHWPQLFPDTIRGARLLGKKGNETTVEVDHRTAGRVLNIIRRRSATEIELDELKPRYAATFLNRFDPVPEGTRYTVVADIRLRMPYALLAPILMGYVRRMVRRYVLEPMRELAEQGAPA